MEKIRNIKLNSILIASVLACTIFIPMTSANNIEYMQENFSVDNIKIKPVKIEGREELVLYENQHLIPSDLDNEDCFGNAVAMSKNFLFVGSPHDDDVAIYAGAVYIYYFDGAIWYQVQKIYASDGSLADCFGSSISVDGDYAIIGAPGHNELRGAAYLFFYDGTRWNESQKLYDFEGTEEDYFGWSVDIDDNIIVIGTNAQRSGPESQQYGINSTIGVCGFANVYRKKGSMWKEEQKLVPSDGRSDDRFGYSVAVCNDSIIIGSPQDDNLGLENVGSSYIYTNISYEWIVQQKLIPSDIGENHIFGTSVDIDGYAAVVGAPGVFLNPSNTGATYVFRCDISQYPPWDEEAIIIPQGDSIPFLNFGSAVSLDGNRLLVGSFDYWVPGSANLFEYDGLNWLQNITYLASDGAGGDEFGTSVSLYDNMVAIGSPKDDDMGYSSGSAYIFSLKYCDLNYDGSVDILDLLFIISHWGNLDSPADINKDGIVDVLDLLLVINNWS